MAPGCENKSIHAFAAGDFAVELARQLAAATGASVSDLSRVRKPWPPAFLYILACWRPLRAAEETLDRLVFDEQRCFLPVVCRHPLVQVGPLIAPGLSACAACARLRERQHDTSGGVAQTVESAYESGTGQGPAGFLPSHATAVAGLVTRIIERFIETPTSEAGLVRQFDLLSSRVAKGRVVAVHGCPRCARWQPTAGPVGELLQVHGDLRNRATGRAWG